MTSPQQCVLSVPRCPTTPKIDRYYNSLYYGDILTRTAAERPLSIKSDCPGEQGAVAARMKDHSLFATAHAVHLANKRDPAKFLFN